MRKSSHETIEFNKYLSELAESLDVKKMSLSVQNRTKN